MVASLWRWPGSTALQRPPAMQMDFASALFTQGAQIDVSLQQQSHQLPAPTIELVFQFAVAERGCLVAFQPPDQVFEGLPGRVRAPHLTRSPRVPIGPRSALASAAQFGQPRLRGGIELNPGRLVAGPKQRAPRPPLCRWRSVDQGLVDEVLELWARCWTAGHRLLTCHLTVAKFRRDLCEPYKCKR